MVDVGVVLDSSFLIDLLREEPAAIGKLDALERGGDRLLLATPALYELLAGVRHHRSRTDADRFEAFLTRFPVVDFDRRGAATAAQIRSELLRMGKVKGDVDVMIAGTVLSNNYTLVSRDKDFEEIAAAFGLQIQGY